MYAVADSAESVLVGNGAHARAEKIQGRLTKLGISDREFSDRSGIDRKALRRAANGQPVRPSTYAAVESWLDRLEAEVGIGVPPLPEGAQYLGDPEDQLVQIIVEGNKVIVKGPIEDIDKLTESAARLISGMRQQESTKPEND